MTEVPGHFPFRPGFEPMEGGHNLYEYKNGPETVIRDLEVSDLELQENYMTITEYLNEVKRLFGELEESYGIPVAHPSAALAGKKNEGKYVFAVERIPGRSFNREDFQNMPEQEREAGRRILEKAYTYTRDKIDTGEAFITNHITDIEQQYVYDPGRKDFVFVDLEPFLNAERGKNFDRVDSEVDTVVNLLNGAAKLGLDDEAKEAWKARGYELLDLVCERNGYHLTGEQKEKLIESSIALAEAEDYLTILDDVLTDANNMPENEAYKRGKYAKIMAAAQRAREDRESQENGNG